MGTKPRIFIFEYAVCSNQSLPPSIAVEGLAMFKTLYPGFENPHSFYSFTDYIEAFKNCLEKSDYALVIAPETGMELHRLTRLVEKSDCENLGSNSGAVKFASDKLLTFKKLKHLSPKTKLFKKKASFNFPFICKPRDGVSGEGVSLIRSENELNKVPRGYLAQEYIEGKPMSASILIGDEIRILSINTQELNGFKYTGAKLPVELSNIHPIIEAIECIPGLKGYVGVDFVQTSNGPVIIEINSRATTPIVGLNRALGINISDLILKNARHKQIPLWKRQKTVHLKKTRSSSGLFYMDGYSIQVVDLNEDIVL